MESRRTEEFIELLSQVPEERRWCKEYVQGKYMLMCSHESDGDEDKACEVAKEIINNIDLDVSDDDIIKTCYDVMARNGDFEAFMIAMEWNRPMSKKFYLPRARLLKKHGLIDALQGLQDDKYDLVVLNMPPRSGKSTLSIFFLAMRAALYPELSILGNGCTTVLTDSFYKEFLNFVTSDEYRFSEIFPSINIVNKSSEYDYLDFNTEKRFHTVTFRSVDATTTGVAEASNLLYCDDLVKDVETANSKERLDKLYHTYTGTMKDRKVSRLCKDGVYRSCPELHVNTPWSIHDVTSRVIKDAEKMENDDRVKIVSVPCWDEQRRSNFEYDYGKGFNTRYYEEMEVAEDPVIFSAKYLMKPIEREGRPFERDSLIYFDELPLDEKGNTKTPDRVVAYNDVSHGGNDYMSMPIAYVYGTDVYIVDVLFMRKFDGDAYSRPKVCEKIINWKIASCGFEKNNGGDFYESLIHEDLINLGVRCHTIAFNASTRQSKLDRILSCQSDIHGDSMLNGTFRLFFRNPASLQKNSEYMVFLENLWGWNQKEGSIQKSQHDDAPDSLAGLIINMLGKRLRGGFSLYDIRDAGY